MAVYLGLGSNLGNRRANLAMALRMLEPLCRVEAVSALYESAPQPPAPPPAYLNAVCRIVTGLTPQLLLRHIKRIEQLIGRHDPEHWAPRPIDIDILLFDDEVLVGPELTLPHPRLLERAFVLQPLVELDASLVHPATGERLLEVSAGVASDGLVRVAEQGWHEVALMPS
jgi:2-amino-4-hydroxy-6-hydroxymethyldihydropteridine diphosphokinase